MYPSLPLISHNPVRSIPWRLSYKNKDGVWKLRLVVGLCVNVSDGEVKRSFSEALNPIESEKGSLLEAF